MEPGQVGPGSGLELGLDPGPNCPKWSFGTGSGPMRLHERELKQQIIRKLIRTVKQQNNKTNIGGKTCKFTNFKLIFKKVIDGMLKKKNNCRF